MKYKILNNKTLTYKCLFCDYKTKYLYRIEKHSCKSFKLSKSKELPVRIRYQKTNESGILESVRTFTNSKLRKNDYTKYKVYLDENNFIFKIKNTKTGQFYVSKKETENLELLREKAKNYLERLGVKFKTPTRKVRKIDNKLES
jgi:hypothetical protein